MIMRIVVPIMTVDFDCARYMVTDIQVLMVLVLSACKSKKERKISKTIERRIFHLVFISEAILSTPYKAEMSMPHLVFRKGDLH
jgi:hypothetical protein